MKKTILLFAIVAAITTVSCNSKPASSGENDSAMKHDGNMSMSDTIDTDIKEVNATFTSVDPGVASFMKALFGSYFAVKNALVTGNENSTAAASAQMNKVMKNFDKSLFTADQKKVYDGVEDDLLEHTEHISKSKIDHQREHFSMMSEDMYALAKAFGAGKTIYHDHCPMYNNNKGAMWLSETKEIKNPYMGSKMTECGSVEEMLK
jgi:hypothetical protein